MKKAFLFIIISLIVGVLTLTMMPLALNADFEWKSETESYFIPDAGITHNWTNPNGVGISFVNVSYYWLSNPGTIIPVWFFTQDGTVGVTVTGIGTPNISVTWPSGSGDNAQAVVEYRWSTTVRTSEMVCQNVWINEDNHFQFSFINLYADNNWVRIYDMEGNMVYEVDMPLKDGNLKVDLPDGMYMVKTFHDQPEPIQEFMIGKPAAEPAPDAEM